MIIRKYNIELEEEVLRALRVYCEENEISINQFIKSNLEAIGVY